MHMREPHAYGEDYTDSVLEVLTSLGAKRYSLVGSMYDMVPHTGPLLISGGARQPGHEEEYQSISVRPSDYQGPTSITYLINQQPAGCQRLVTQGKSTQPKSRATGQ